MCVYMYVGGTDNTFKSCVMEITCVCIQNNCLYLLIYMCDEVLDIVIDTRYFVEIVKGASL